MPTGRIDLSRRALDTSLQEFGDQLRHKRECVLHLSQAQLAARVGLDQSSISRIEAGHKPRDKAAAVALAGAYRLSRAETNGWLELLFGASLLLEFDRGVVDDHQGEWLARAYAVLERLRPILPPDSHHYFNPYSTEQLSRLEPGFDAELIAIVDWVLADGHRLPRAHLLVECATVLMHHLNERGQHRRRLALALAAADAAAELERRTVEGWLRADAIPWTLMEHRHDPAAAQPHLERGLALAQELKNRDMEALALAFVAQTELVTGDNRRAAGHLGRARRLNPAPPVQTRVEWINGDLALRQRRYENALTLYRAAAAVDSGADGDHHTVTPLFRQAELYMRVGDLTAATESYATLLAGAQPPLVGGRLARALFGLARLARQAGEIDRARQLADGARTALATADDNPQFRQVIALFIRSLPA